MTAVFLNEVGRVFFTLVPIIVFGYVSIFIMTKFTLIAVTTAAEIYDRYLRNDPLLEQL